MKRNCLFVLVLAALAATFPGTVQGGFFYEFVGLPAAPVNPGTEVQVEVRLTETGTNVFDAGVIAAAVQIAPVPGLVLNAITPGPDWDLSTFSVPTGYWDGATGPESSLQTNSVLLATYSFTAHQTATFTAVDPMTLGDNGSAIDVNFNSYLVGGASGTVSVVPEPSTLIGWSLGLVAVVGCGWARSRRGNHRRLCEKCGPLHGE